MTKERCAKERISDARSILLSSTPRKKIFRSGKNIFLRARQANRDGKPLKAQPLGPQPARPASGLLAQPGSELFERSRITARKQPGELVEIER
jgi:hypothetical protein